MFLVYFPSMRVFFLTNMKTFSGKNMIAISDATLLSSSVSFQLFGSWLVFSMITCDEIRNYSEHNISYYNIVLRATDHLSLGWTGKLIQISTHWS